jgi:hypothetical protein
MATIGKYGKILFSQSDIEFIRNNFNSMTNKAIAEVLGLKITRVRTFAYEIGLKRMELEYWTADQVAFLKANYQEIGDVEMAEFFENEWPKNKAWSKKHIEKKRRYLNLKRNENELHLIKIRNTINGRFAICNKKRWEVTGSNEIGTIVFWSISGSKIAHIKTESGYVHYNRYLWEKHYGKIPAGHNIVKKVGCLELPTIENLEMITRAQHVKRIKTRYNSYPEELKELIRIKNKLTRTIKKNDRSTTQQAQ